MATFALIMSGGGARGAYEAGVLSYVLDELPRRLGRPVRFQILTGTSVGAIHACYVAATLGRPDAGRGLIDIWRSLQVGGVYNVGVGDVVGIPLRLLGLTRQRKTPPEGAIPERLTGLLDTLPLERLVRESIPWANLRHRVETGEIDAIAVAATEISTGKSVVWSTTARASCAAGRAIRSWWLVPPSSRPRTRSPRRPSRSSFRRRASTAPTSATAGSA